MHGNPELRRRRVDVYAGLSDRRGRDRLHVPAGDLPQLPLDRGRGELSYFLDAIEQYNHGDARAVI